MKKFKLIITNDESLRTSSKQNKVIKNFPIRTKVFISIDKNNQIHDIMPRNMYGIDLFSKYHGRTSDWVVCLIDQIKDIERHVQKI